MRKKLIVAFLFICSLQMVFASATQLIGTRQIHVSGVLGDMHSISVTPISSTSIDSAEGMPFDLRSEDVAAQPGRRIATWSLHSNYLPVTLKVDADDLEFTSSNGTVATVPYVLRFAYSYPVYSTSETGESESELESGFFFIGSEGATAEYGKTYTFGAEEELQGLEVISSPESDIRFFLALPEGEIDKDDIYPPGDPYVATVTLTIEGTI